VLHDSAQQSNPNPAYRSDQPVVCLAGFMGSGKTTVGVLLARQLAWRFEDLDARIEQSAGLTISSIFERRGEAAFREIEREQLEKT
jgi:shikimate kinase